MKRFIKISHKDNVAVALADDLREGERIEVGDLSICLRKAIPRGHKFSLRTIGKDEPVVKYGYPIGHAACHIEPGEWVHSHNLSTSLGDNLEYAYHPLLPSEEVSKNGECPTIDAYLRSSGETGIRNDLWILPTVGCVNGSAQAIARRLQQHAENSLTQQERRSIDDIIAFTHNYGCSQLGDDHANTRRALAALALHPNAGGVLIIGLGCENNRIDRLREEIELLAQMKGENVDWQRIRFLISQEVEDEVEEGVRLGSELLSAMAADSRQPLPFSGLKIGLKCGGSDGLSGITANPLVGLLTDRIVAWGATAVLTEVPEMFGAETLLMDRAVNREVFEKTVELINNFKDYFRQSGQPVYENPSPGNKAGGITTLEEKSLGCVQKGGHLPVAGVVDYGYPVTAGGLNLLNAPGNDLVASTALALSGCQMVLFTTGRGTPFGTCVPTLKISTNSDLSRRKPGWIDYNAGGLAEGRPWEEALDSLTDAVVSVADGEKTAQERSGHKEIAIFKTGVTL